MKSWNSPKSVKSGVPEKLSISCPTCGTRHDLHQIIGNQLYRMSQLVNKPFNIMWQRCKIWKLVHACVIPIMTYGTETWTPSKAEIKETPRILRSSLKRIYHNTHRNNNRRNRDMETQISKVTSNALLQNKNQWVTRQHNKKTSNGSPKPMSKTCRVNPLKNWNQHKSANE